MTQEPKALATVERALTDSEFKHKHTELAKFVKNVLREAKPTQVNGRDSITSGDYGIIPRTTKKSLLKPGAEKLLKLFGFTAHMELVKEVEDFKAGFVMYKYRCTITHAATGTYIADSIRSCNNKESKHASKNVYDVANTIESVAQKRALVAATVQATMASEIFEADTSDYDGEAPGRTVTKEEDPRRNKVTMGLWGVVKRHGWNDEWIHRAIKKKWDIDSLKDCSNEQIEELKEFIEEKYEEVSEGERPKLKDSGPVKVEQPTSGPVDGEIVEDPEDYRATCANCKTKYLPEDVQDLEPENAIHYCSKRCMDEYYPQKKEKTYPWEKKGEDGKASTTT